jgi:hypothetical protein
MDQGPNTWVKERPALWRSVKRWQTFMMHANGRPVAAAILEAVPCIKGHKPIVNWTSDACTADAVTAVEGMGGFDMGSLWQYLMPKSQMGILHITSLEACAQVGNTIHFGPQHPEGTQICREADAISTVTLLETEVSKTEEMLHIHNFHENLPDYIKLRPTTTTQHIFGELNYFSDLISRNKMEEFETACRQMGIRPRRVHTSPHFETFMDDLVKHHLSQ